MRWFPIIAGALPHLTNGDITLVTDYDLDRHWLRCVGPGEASSESLTHAACYRCRTTISAVAHVHCRDRWRRNRGRLPTTAEQAAPGSTAMTVEIMRLFAEEISEDCGLLVMGGHADGLLAYGPTVDHVCTVLLTLSTS